MINHFNLPCAQTCHSVQGLTIPGKITIFDIDSYYASREWIWTALTRVNSLKNIKI